MRVLLVEPDSVLSAIYANALTAAGHDIVAARTAQNAVHVADEQTPDVVVLELQIPCHNGVEFLYEFRSYPEWQSIPVIIHSFTPGSELEHMPTVMAELNVTALLYKPTTDLETLVRVVGASAPVAAA